MAGRSESSFITPKTHTIDNFTAPVDAAPIPTEREWFDLFTRVAVALEKVK